MEYFRISMSLKKIAEWVQKRQDNSHESTMNYLNLEVKPQVSKHPKRHFFVFVHGNHGQATDLKAVGSELRKVFKNSAFYVSSICVLMKLVIFNIQSG